MLLPNKIRVLIRHGIRVRLTGSTLHAEETTCVRIGGVLTTCYTWVDATDWNRNDLYGWLGY